MSGARIKSESDDDLQYRRQEVRVRGKAVTTPVKSVDPAKLPGGMRLSDRAPCINEMYTGVTKKSLSSCIEGQDHTIERRLSSLQRRFRDPQSDLQLCFIEYKEQSLPTTAEIGLMTDLAHGHSDMTPLPMLSGFVDRVSNITFENGKKRITANRTKWERVLKYLADSIGTIEQLNDKPVMGYVPSYRLYFDELVKLYTANGINTFYFDAHGSNPITLKAHLRAFMRELNNAGALEKSLVYMINPGPGRTIHDNSVIPAKDILGFGLGVDCLGEKHIQMRLSPEAMENMRKNPDNRSRLFDKETYGYLKTDSSDRIKRFYPGDSSIDKSQFLSGTKPDNKIQNAFNVEQLGLESARLSGMLAASEPLIEYVSGKASVSETDVKILRGAKVRQRK